MAELNDYELLMEYATRGSESAFATLTARYVNLVYSAAARQVHPAHLADDVTQAVFIILSKKARSFREGVILSGWLLRATRFTAANVMDTQYRRSRREQEAAQMELNSSNEFTWEQISPLLDGAMAELREKDRNALALRFFEQKPLKEVGLALGIDADTARKRVARAVDKLRRVLLKRGVTLSAAAMAAALSANTVQAAPAALVASITTVGMAEASASTSAAIPTLIQTTLKALALAKLKVAIVCAIGMVLATGLGVGILGYAAAAHPERLDRLKLPVGPGTPAVILGARHGLILASNGSLWSWGENWAGWPVLGLGNVRTQASLHRIGNEADWMGIASSYTHSLALKSNGTLWAWGENSEAQLGDGTRVPRQSMPVPSAPGKDWKQVAVGDNHSVALKADGTLWSWGGNWAGQLGIGHGSEAVPGAVQVGSNKNWTKVWAGNLSTVGQQADGTLWVWGSLTGGSKDTNRFLVPTRLSPDTNWVDVCFGYFMTFAIKADGTLWAWGRQAGIYTGQPEQTANITPARVGTNSDWKACSSSDYFYHLLMKNDGSLWALDAFDHRFVNKSVYKPVTLSRIEPQKDFVAFAPAGRSQTGAALTRDGEVWTWGQVLGEGSFGNKPLQVLATLMNRARPGHNYKWGEPAPRMVDKPWRLTHVEPTAPATP